jgi:hypothetical protein
MAQHEILPRFAKVVVSFEPREDGGLRAYSSDVPGFVLSHKDPLAVIRDVRPALAVILSAMWGVDVRADLLPHVGEPSEDIEDDAPEVSAFAGRERDYVAHVS